jgi:hypothetical protein
VKSPFGGPKPTEPSSKENLGWMEITGGSTPSPVLVLSPKIGPLSDQVSAVESKPASWGRIKTSHFFPINRSKMFWQEADLRFFEQWR